MNENWHEVRQQLNRQLEIEREAAKLRRQRKWAVRKLAFTTKAQAIWADAQFFLMRRADSTP